MLLRKDIGPGQICQIVLLCEVLLWKHLLLKIVWWNSWSSFRGSICSNLAVLVYKILRIKCITLSFRLSNLKSFTIPFVGGKNRSSGTTKLPYWKKQTKRQKTLFGQTALPPPCAGWDSVQFFFVWCSKHRSNCTQRGWDRLGIWFAILLPVAGVDTVCVFKKRPKDGTLCPVLLFPSHLALSYAQKEYQHLLCQHHHRLKPEGLSIWQAKGNQKGMLSCWN